MVCKTPACLSSMILRVLLSFRKRVRVRASSGFEFFFNFVWLCKNRTGRAITHTHTHTHKHTVQKKRAKKIKRTLTAVEAWCQRQEGLLRVRKKTSQEKTINSLFEKLNFLKWGKKPKENDENAKDNEWKSWMKCLNWQHSHTHTKWRSNLILVWGKSFFVP